MNPGHQTPSKIFITSETEALIFPHDFWRIFLQRQTNRQSSGRDRDEAPYLAELGQMVAVCVFHYKELFFPLTSIPCLKYHWD